MLKTNSTHKPTKMFNKNRGFSRLRLTQYIFRQFMPSSGDTKKNVQSPLRRVQIKFFLFVVDFVTIIVILSVNFLFKSIKVR
jgi:hypothetical protein